MERISYYAVIVAMSFAVLAVAVTNLSSSASFLQLIEDIHTHNLEKSASSNVVDTRNGWRQTRDGAAVRYKLPCILSGRSYNYDMARCEDEKPRNIATEPYWNRERQAQ